MLSLNKIQFNLFKRYNNKIKFQAFCLIASDGEDILSSKSITKPKTRVGSLLAGKEPEPFSICKTATIREAVTKLGSSSLSATLVTDLKGNVVGIVTARDILRYIDEFQEEQPNKRLDDCLHRRIHEAMTPGDKIVYCSPTDTVSRCREIMFQNGIRHVPVIQEGEILGIIGIKDIADSVLGVTVTGGKKGFISNVVGHKGLPSDTRVRLDKAQLLAPPQLGVGGGEYALPHPFKRENSVAHNQRQYGADELSTDLSLCEDAHFLISLDNIQPNKPKQVYACVADGVGSWRQYGIDPKNYSHKITEYAKEIIETESASQMETISLFGRDVGIETEILHPFDVLMEAWHRTTADKIEGSSTICIATIDYTHNQLVYSNVGDCGLMVLRHIDSETAGYLRDRHLPRHLRQNDLRIAYLSQQQLRSFNLPYQLGYIENNNEYKIHFESPSDADTASIPVLPGDIIILATDGLYDNIDLNDIITIVEEWEKKWFPVTPTYPNKGESLKYPYIPTTTSSTSSESDPELAVCNELAHTLVIKAREYSLDKNKDSPFALLAKENDIMWGGGMPDDTSVIVLRVINTNYNSTATPNPNPNPTSNPT